MTKKTAIVVVVEGLGTSLLGAYGGAWCRTPNLDAFAAHSLVCDDFWLDSTRRNDSLDRWYRSMLTGQHAAAHSGLPLDIHASIDDSLLVTDQPNLLSCSVVEKFGDAQVLTDALSVGERTDDWTQCQLPRAIELGLEKWLGQKQRPSLLWIHLAGLMGPWDAPFEMREELRDEEDPPIRTESSPPNILMRTETDLDDRIAWVQAAAAQVTLLDRAWSYIDLALSQTGIADSTATALLGLGGYPMGEHGRIGFPDESFFVEANRVPLIVRPGNGRPIGFRSSAIFQLPDIWDAVNSWRNSVKKTPTGRQLGFEHCRLIADEDLALVCGESKTGLRTRLWASVPADKAVRLPGEPAIASDVRLYVMPEDRWQQNDVASRASREAIAIQELEEQAVADIANGEHTDVPDVLKTAQR